MNKYIKWIDFMQDSFGLSGFNLNADVYHNAAKVASFLDKTTKFGFQEYSRKKLNSFLPVLEKNANSQKYIAKKVLKYLNDKVLKAKTPKKARERVVALLSTAPKLTALHKTLPFFKSDLRRSGRQATEGMQDQGF